MLLYTVKQARKRKTKVAYQQIYMESRKMVHINIFEGQE